LLEVKMFWPLTAAKGELVDAYAMNPLSFRVEVGGDFFEDLGDFGSGGGDGLLVSRGLSSFSASSRGLLRGSEGVFSATLLSCGPWLVPRSKNLRFRFLSPISTSTTSSAATELVTSPSTTSFEAAFGVLSILMRSGEIGSTTISLSGVTALILRQLISSTPWLICRTLIFISCRGEALRVGDPEFDLD